MFLHETSEGALWFRFIRSTVETLNLHLSRSTWASMFLTLIKTLLSTLTTHRSLALENLALRQQNTKSRTLTQGLRKSLLDKVDGIFRGDRRIYLGD